MINRVFQRTWLWRGGFTSSNRLLKKIGLCLRLLLAPFQLILWRTSTARPSYNTLSLVVKKTLLIKFASLKRRKVAIVYPFLQDATKQQRWQLVAAMLQCRIARRLPLHCFRSSTNQKLLDLSPNHVNRTWLTSLVTNCWKASERPPIYVPLQDYYTSQKSQNLLRGWKRACTAGA